MRNTLGDFENANFIAELTKNYSHPHALLCAKNPVTRIAQSWHDVSMFIQMRIQRCGEHFHIWMRILKNLHTLRGSHLGQEDD